MATLKNFAKQELPRRCGEGKRFASFVARRA
jgi:hypothetical protein